MINDRLNGGSTSNSGKFRNKKFVSTVAIGIFVLILLIVLVAKGCSRRTRPEKSKLDTTQGQTPPPALEQPPVSTVAPAPAPVTETPPPPAVVQPPQPAVVQPPQPEDEARRLIKEGQEYYNGDGGKKQNYAEARKCFLKAKKLGAKDADIWLKKCAKKLPKKAAPRKKKK